MRLFFFLTSFLLLINSCQRKVKEFRNEKGFIEVFQGDEFKILFNEDHSKGQSWSLVSEFDHSKLEYIKSNYHGPSRGLTDFIFEAKTKGDMELKFNLIEFSEVIKSVSLKIKIK